MAIQETMRTAKLITITLSASRSDPAGLQGVVSRMIDLLRQGYMLMPQSLLGIPTEPWLELYRVEALPPVAEGKVGDNLPRPLGKLTPVKALGISEYLEWALRNLGVKTIDQLLEVTEDDIWREAWTTHNDGVVEEAKALLSRMGLSLSSFEEKPRELLSRSIRELNLPFEIRNTLLYCGINTVNRLCGETEKTLLAIKTVTNADILRINGALARYRLSLHKGGAKDRPSRSVRSFAVELNLSTRSYNCLINSRVGLVGELCQKTEREMLKTKNFGERSLQELKKALGRWRLSLQE